MSASVSCARHSSAGLISTGPSQENLRMACPRWASHVWNVRPLSATVSRHSTGPLQGRSSPGQKGARRHRGRVALLSLASDRGRLWRLSILVIRRATFHPIFVIGLFSICKGQNDLHYVTSCGPPLDRWVVTYLPGVRTLDGHLVSPLRPGRAPGGDKKVKKVRSGPFPSRGE